MHAIERATAGEGSEEKSGSAIASANPGPSPIFTLFLELPNDPIDNRKHRWAALLGLVSTAHRLARFAGLLDRDVRATRHLEARRRPQRRLPHDGGLPADAPCAVAGAGRVLWAGRPSEESPWQELRRPVGFIGLSRRASLRRLPARRRPRRRSGLGPPPQAGRRDIAGPLAIDAQQGRSTPGAPPIQRSPKAGRLSTPSARSSSGLPRALSPIHEPRSTLDGRTPATRRQGPPPDQAPQRHRRSLEPQGPSPGLRGLLHRRPRVVAGGR